MPEPPDQPHDEELVLRAQAGDDAAFEQLFYRYHMGIHAFAFRCCLDHTAAGDIAQETFIKAARALTELRAGVAFKSWLYRIARNTARDWQRGDTREALRREAWQHAVSITTARPNDHFAVVEALHALAPDLREAVVLTFYEKMSHAEAARVLGCAEATVSWRVFRAKRLLRKKLLSSFTSHHPHET